MSLTQIKSNLQELKLHGMMESLEDVFNQMNRQSITGLEALDILLQKEKQVRGFRSMQFRMQRSKIRKGASLEDYDLTHKRSLSKDQFKELASLNWCVEGKGLIFIGPTGIGKTYLVRALGLLACQQGHTVLFSSFTDFLEHQSLSRRQGTFLEFRERYIRPQLLCLDDLGMRKMSALEAEDLRDIIEQRSYGKSTVITTQLPFEHWSEVISDSIILDALIDRLKGPSLVITLEGPSYRPKLINKKR